MKMSSGSIWFIGEKPSGIRFLLMPRRSPRRFRIRSFNILKDHNRLSGMKAGGFDETARFRPEYLIKLTRRQALWIQVFPNFFFPQFANFSGSPCKSL